MNTAGMQPYLDAGQIHALPTWARFGVKTTLALPAASVPFARQMALAAGTHSHTRATVRNNINLHTKIEPGPL